MQRIGVLIVLLSLFAAIGCGVARRANRVFATLCVLSTLLVALPARCHR